MVPDRVESRATARLTEFLKRKNISARGKPVLTSKSALTRVTRMKEDDTGKSVKAF